MTCSVAGTGSAPAEPAPTQARPAPTGIGWLPPPSSTRAPVPASDGHAVRSPRAQCAAAGQPLCSEPVFEQVHVDPLVRVADAPSGIHRQRCSAVRAVGASKPHLLTPRARPNRTRPKPRSNDPLRTDHGANGDHHGASGNLSSPDQPASATRPTASVGEASPVVVSRRTTPTMISTMPSTDRTVRRSPKSTAPAIATIAVPIPDQMA